MLDKTTLEKLLIKKYREEGKYKDIKVAIGGMIASGKSTLAEALAKNFDLPLIEEFDQDDKVFETLLTWLYEGKPNVEMLLQIYFIHHHYLRQLEMPKGHIVDRYLIEHWLFAQENLKHVPKVMNMYNGLFHTYLNETRHPDLYIILDINWETFKERIFERGRASEIDNFDQNETYFKNLLESYTKRLKAQCVIHNIPYIILDVNHLTEAQVLEITMDHINKHIGLD